MRIEGQRESDNVEDRRGQSVGPKMAAGGGFTIIIFIIALLLGKNPMQLLNQMGGAGGLPGGGGPRAQAPVDPAEDELARFVKIVLADTEDVWKKLFRDMGKVYQEPKLVLFTDQVNSACGFADAAVGPFYCPGDSNVYIDLSFYKELKDRFGAPGDFAQAYVLAHEVGHHVQNLLGVSDEVHKKQQAAGKVGANKLSVRLELQADFLAGVWAHHAQKMRQILEQGDIEEAMRAANVIGDDKLQMQAQGRVVPDSFTHGTSKQRMKWFSLGLKTGSLKDVMLPFKVDEDEL